MLNLLLLQCFSWKKVSNVKKIIYFVMFRISEILQITRRVSMNWDKQSVSLLQSWLTEHKEYIHLYTIYLFQFNLHTVAFYRFIKWHTDWNCLVGGCSLSCDGQNDEGCYEAHWDHRKSTAERCVLWWNHSISEELRSRIPVNNLTMKNTIGSLNWNMGVPFP